MVGWLVGIIIEGIKRVQSSPYIHVVSTVFLKYMHILYA